MHHRSAVLYKDNNSPTSKKIISNLNSTVVSSFHYTDVVFLLYRLDAGPADLSKTPLPDIPELPPSRPLTPSEQMDIMRAIEQEEVDATGIPSDRDEEVGGRLLLDCLFQHHCMKFFFSATLYKKHKQHTSTTSEIRACD